MAKGRPRANVCPCRKAGDNNCRCDGSWHDGSLEAGPPVASREGTRTTIPAGESFDEGKKGPWIKFDSFDQARRVLRYLPAEHGHPQVMAFIAKLREAIEQHESNRKERL